MLAAPLGAVAQSAAQSERGPEGTRLPVAHAAPQTKIDVNTADIPTLEAIPEIGTDLTNAVVAARPFKSVDDLARVRGITPQKMATLRERVWVSPPPAPTATPTGQKTAGPSKPAPTKKVEATSAQEVTERYDRAQANKPEAKKH